MMIYCWICCVDTSINTRSWINMCQDFLQNAAIEFAIPEYMNFFKYFFKYLDLVWSIVLQIWPKYLVLDQMFTSPYMRMFEKYLNFQVQYKYFSYTQ